ncbi:MAG: GNAT family N-acetyltransferase [Flavobacteriales bacterium]
MKAEKLEWDSAFFNINIAKVSTSVLLSRKDFVFGETDLYYLFSDIRQPQLEAENVLLADAKVTYHKNLTKVSDDLNNNIISLTGDISEELYQLAISSGWSSRFNKDPRLQPKFEELYRLWLSNSVNRKIADEVLVMKMDDQAAGLVTLKKNASAGKIGIIAVQEQHKGKGWGSQLLNAVDQWYQNNGVNYAEVVTQSDNTEACRFYEKRGYTVKNTEYVYHVWRA